MNSPGLAASSEALATALEQESGSARTLERLTYVLQEEIRRAIQTGVDLDELLVPANRLLVAYARLRAVGDSTAAELSELRLRALFCSKFATSEKESILSMADLRSLLRASLSSGLAGDLDAFAVGGLQRTPHNVIRRLRHGKNVLVAVSLVHDRLRSDPVVGDWLHRIASLP